jgi:SecD/SecF fusion protein
MGATGAGIPRWLRLDYIGLRRIWFAFSGVVVAAALAAIAIQGLNLGIDFEGGTQIRFRTEEPRALEEVRAEAGGIGQAGAVIQGRGEAENGAYSRFQIRTESLTVDESDRLKEQLTDEVGASRFSEQTVSESFGGQIANAALLAIFVSLLLIVTYISVRFHWKYSVGVLVALAHDVTITVGFYALTGREVSTATVAAVLTVLGYSIYDTIIIFDRMRENVPLMRRASFRVIGNVSLWEVLPRSLATSFITLVPIAALYFFGGDTLKDFAFALLVGIGFGAYSSVFLAAPLVAVFKEREPEFAKRRDDLGALEGVESIGGVLLDEELGTDEEGDGAGPTREEPPAEPAPTAPGPASDADMASKRERRRQRRASRPHGRAR